MILTPTKIVAKVREKASDAKAWADLANFVFDQETGILAEAFPDCEERRNFGHTDEYREIWRIIEEVQNRTGLVEGATPLDGDVIVRIPRALFPALVQEAIQEGVSVDQLVAGKLAAKPALATSILSSAG